MVPRLPGIGNLRKVGRALQERNDLRLALGIIGSIARPERADHLLAVADARIDADVVPFVVEPEPFRGDLDRNRHILEPLPFARKCVETKIVEAKARECTPGYGEHAFGGRLAIKIRQDLVRFPYEAAVGL